MFVSTAELSRHGRDNKPVGTQGVPARGLNETRRNPILPRGGGVDLFASDTQFTLHTTDKLGKDAA